MKITKPPSIEAIRNTLEQALEPDHLRVVDESEEHAGHAGAQSGGHFQIIIVSEGFTGTSRIHRHRAVYAALKDWMSNGIHALAIEAFTPDEWTAAGE